jgi:hypothetical protein
MTVAAKITPTELGDQVRDRFISNFFVVKLLFSNGLAYTPGQQDSLQFVIDYELSRISGYEPQIIGYVPGEVSIYADGGVGLAQKQAIFQHDNSATSYTFDQVSLQWAGGVVNIVEIDELRNPGPLTDADYSNVPVATVTGDGSGLTVNFSVFNGAIVSMTPNTRGYDYNTTDILEITSGTLASIGAHDGNGGAQGVLINDLYLNSKSGQVVLIAPTAQPVTLAGGNESAVYFNYKNFGYYNTL